MVKKEGRKEGRKEEGILHTGVAERDRGRLAVKDLLHVLVDVDAAGVAECDHLQYGSCVSPEYGTSFPFPP